MALPKVWRRSFLAFFLPSVLLTISILSFGADPKLNFKVKTVYLDKQKMNVWWADTDQKRNQGMMFKTKWPDGVHGMLFIFDSEGPRSFWMKNTFLPLSIGFFNAKGELLDRADMNPAKSLAQIKVDRAQTQKPAKYVLEVPQGWFKKHQIKSGSKLRIP